MGREIVRRESPNDPGRRSRLWRYEDVNKNFNHGNPDLPLGYEEIECELSVYGEDFHLGDSSYPLDSPEAVSVPRVAIRNSAGEFLGGLAASRVGHSALVVEAEAAVMGLEFAANLGYSDVYVETDSKTLVDGIKGDIRNRAWTIRPFIEVIWRRADQFRIVFGRWVQRSSNRAAHEAAAIGCRAVELESWVTQPPLSLIHVLVSNGLPRSP
ncbi:PREDICTED: reverse mRNAase [Prunus dulcis]|uniref:PREDICTED: reverse mRNAase n=1 Tax=Prunus dulcis TaxID=3755 RepID=A0A5E4ELC5_PRUDU|nr:hypothetical protein L3X38_008546 [Prunus dulcis]VVA16212.1 PREDICTED: reverse mRNAase [Prunus dulcis]